MEPAEDEQEYLCDDKTFIKAKQVENFWWSHNVVTPRLPPDGRLGPEASPLNVTLHSGAVKTLIGHEAKSLAKILERKAE